MNSKVKVLSIVFISALLLIIILWAAGVFKSGPESYLEDTSCTYCPGANYLEFFESNFGEENLTIEYVEKSQRKVIKVKTTDPNEVSTFVYFKVKSDSVVFYKLKNSGKFYLRNSDYVSSYFSNGCSAVNNDSKTLEEEDVYYNSESVGVDSGTPKSSSDDDGFGALVGMFFIAAITFLSGLSFSELLFWILLIVAYVNLIRYLKRGARYYEKITDRMNKQDEAIDTFLKEGSEYFKSKNSEDSDEDW